MMAGSKDQLVSEYLERIGGVDLADDVVGVTSGASAGGVRGNGYYGGLLLRGMQCKICVG